jgi:hypothetical protein
MRRAVCPYCVGMPRMQTWPIPDMALPSARGNVDEFQERGFEPGQKDGAEQ